MSERKKATLSNPLVRNGKTTWDCIWFGNYHQSDQTGGIKDPIKWRVLSVNENDAFLIADQNLEVKRFNEENTNVTWENCTLRSWLNKDFINTAFNSKEQDAILSTRIPQEIFRGGEYSAIDKIYLLSLEEIRNTAYGFPSHDHASDTRVSTNTPYVASKAYMNDSEMGDWWWLRSSGIDDNKASAIDDGGSIYSHGEHVRNNSSAVRPALHLNLSASHVWSYAGTVSSEMAGEKENEQKSSNLSWLT